jgi:hypothetical protein
VTDAAYVLGGWAVTAVVLGGYTARVILRSRKLRRMAAPTGEDREWT